MMFRPYSTIYAPLAPITESEDLNRDDNASLELSKAGAEMVKDLLTINGKVVVNNNTLKEAINKLQNYNTVLSFNRIMFKKQLDDIESAVNFMNSLLEN